MPGGAGRRDPLARTEIRLSMCRMCGGPSAETFVLLGLVCVRVSDVDCSDPWPERLCVRIAKSLLRERTECR